MTVGVITAAASGMGRACVDAMAGSVDHLMGVDVTPVDIPGVTGVSCDVRDDAAVGALADRVRELGEFRFLVSAAGLSPTMADPRAIVDVNLVGTARLLDAFEPLVAAESVAIPFSSSAGYLAEMLTPEQTALLSDVRSADFLDRASTLITDSGIADLFSKVGVQREARQAAVRWVKRGAWCRSRQGRSTPPWAASSSSTSHSCKRHKQHTRCSDSARPTRSQPLSRSSPRRVRHSSAVSTYSSTARNALKASLCPSAVLEAAKTR